MSPSDRVSNGRSRALCAVLHAVRDPYPKTRYPVASVIVMPSWVATALASVLPDRLLDVILEVVANAVGEEM